MQKLSIKQLIIITLCLLVLLVGCMTIHQRRHFNKNVKIDNVSVGGLTANQALKKLQDNPQSPKVYVNNELVFTDKPSIALIWFHILPAPDFRDNSQTKQLIPPARSHTGSTASSCYR